MMLKFAFLGIVLVGFCHALTDSEVMDQFKKFQLEEKKSYKSPLEEARRLKIFRENLELIEEHNVRYRNGEETYEQGVNQFTDWTDEEFIEYIGEITPTFNTSTSLGVFTASPNFTAPASVDWRTKNAVATPQNQGKCLSCWTFSATGALEGQVAIRDKTLTSFSKQNLLDCVRQPKYPVFGCQGGLMSVAFDYVRDNGIQKQSTYPAYAARVLKCRQKNKDLQIQGYKMVDETEDALEEAVATVGPIAVAIRAIRSLSAYKSGIYIDNRCNAGDVNHGVLAVGYGVSSKGLKYWIVKNSWGARWGSRGFFLLRKGTNQCKINSDLNTYPVL